MYCSLFSIKKNAEQVCTVIESCYYCIKISSGGSGLHSGLLRIYPGFDSQSQWFHASLASHS